MGEATETSVQCGPLTVHLPDASEPTFWLMHDLAGLFELATNAEAERRLERALRAARVRGADVDAEADFVFVHARTADAMGEVLEVLRSLADPAPFTSEELAATNVLMRAWRRPSPTSFEVAEVFAVPLAEEAYGAVQILAFTGEGKKRRGLPVVLALDLLAPDVAALAADVTAGRGAPLAARQVLDLDLASGAWPKVGRRVLPDVDAGALVSRERARSGPIACILASCLGVEPWEMFDPHPHEPYLLPSASVPFKRRRREVFERRVVEAFHGSPPATPMAGPATLHVLLGYRGGATEVPVLELPKLRALLREAQTLEHPDLPEEERCVGGGFDGFFDVFVRVADVVAATQHLEAFALAQRLAKDLLVEAYPPFTFDWRGTLRRLRGAG